MTRRISFALLPSLLLFTGCQSASSMFPWMASNEPMYSADQLASVNNPVPAAAQSANAIMPVSAQQTVSAPNGPPAAAARVEQLIQSGRTAIRESGDSDPVKLAEARSMFEEAITLDPSSGSAHHGIAIVADLQQDWASAERHYKQALSQKPQDASLLNDLGYSYVLQNRFHEAAQYLNQAIQISPRHERAHINMALLSLKRGDQETARTQLSGVFPPSEVQNLMAQLENDVQQQNQRMQQAPYQQPPATQQPMMMAQTPAGPWPGNATPVSQQRPVVPQQRQQQQQPATDNRPVHVYPPGIAAELEETNPNPQSQNPSLAANEQTYQQPFYGAPQTNGQPFANAGSYNANSFSGGPNGQMAAANQQQQQYAQFPNGQQPAQTQSGMPVGGILSLPQTATQPAQQYNPAAAAQAAPIMGLNAGPGNLFPIPTQHSTTAPGLQQNFSASATQNSNLPPQGMTNMPYGSIPNSVQLQHQQQQQSPTQNAGFGQPQYNQIQPPQAQYPYAGQQPSNNGYPTNYGTVQGISGQNLNTPVQTASLPVPAVATPYVSPNQPVGSAPRPSASPLSAYERQLQSIDSQYNQAMQQMNGRGLQMPNGQR